MAFAFDTTSFDAPLRAATRSSLSARWMARLERNRRFRRTLAELNTLSDRELADLGMSRSMLRSVAWESSAHT